MLTELNHPAAELLTELNPLSSSALWQRLYRYPSKGRLYYCLMWGQGHAIYGKLHLSGGEVGSPLAESRADLVRAALVRAAPLLELLALVRSFPDAKRGRKPKISP